MGNTTTVEDTARWAEAEALATGIRASPAGRHGWSSPARRPLLIGGAVAVLVLLLGVVVGVVFGGSSDHGDTADVAGWREAVGFVLVFGGLAVAVVSFVRRRRSGVSSWSSPSRVLSWSQRRRVGRQLRGKAPVQERELVVLRAVAQTILVQTRNAFPLWLGLAVSGVGLLVQSDSTFTTVSWCVALVGYAFVVVQLPRSARQMRTFLAEHPAPTSTTGV